MQTQQTREVLHYHYTSWPDFGLPESPASFLDYLEDVRKSGALELDNFGPPVIHCSAGIGRSGTLCLVDSCLIMVYILTFVLLHKLKLIFNKQIEKFGRTDAVNVIDVLLDMRRYRMGLIQTAEQLRFSYLAIIEGSKRLSLGNDANNMSVPFSANNNLNKCKPHSPKIQRSMGMNEEEDFNFENDFLSRIENNLIDNRDDSVLENRNDIELCSTLPPLPPRSRRSMSATSQSSSTSPEPDTKRTKSDSVSSVPQEMISTEEKANNFELKNNSVNSKTDSLSQTKEQELRNRLREEKRRKTADTIERIKKKQKESEERSRLKHNLIQFSLYSIGVAIIGTGIYFIGNLIKGYFSVNTDSSVLPNE